MYETPDVSVVISTFNRAAYLHAALRALLDQDVSDGTVFEVILVDNNSSDDTERVVRDVQSQAHGRLHYVFEGRQGLPYGRNAGVEASAGKVIAFTDDDIRVSPGWVSSIKRVFHEHPDIDGIGGRVLPIWHETPPGWLDSRHLSPLAVTDYGPTPFEITADRPRCLVGANLAFRRAVFSWVGLFSPDFPRGQDHEFQVRFWLGGGRALYTPELVVYTEVPATRLRRRYHRQWHAYNGRMCARMALRERTTPSGAVRQSARVRKTVLGVPRFLFRELGTELGEWLVATARGETADAFAREVAARHLLAYIAERRRLRRADLDIRVPQPPASAADAARMPATAPGARP